MRRPGRRRHRSDETTDGPVDRPVDDRADRAGAPVETETRRERYGGTNIGAAFFGWLVAVALAILLAGIVGAVATAVGTSIEVTQTAAEREAGTIGITSAVVLLIILAIAYYSGGYVAGRMSRFDGGRQGASVWGVGLLVTLIVVGLGVLFGSEYDIFQRMNLPSLPVPTDSLAVGGLIALVVVLLGTLLAAIAGGLVGTRYHHKADRLPD